MTTPTQTQIEAAAKAIWSHPVSMTRHWQDHIPLAQAALTAAAQVDKLDMEDCDGDLAEIEQIAESRENIIDHDRRDGEIKPLKPKHSAPVAATIERCAQVAEEWKHSQHSNTALFIAAAIRKLKETPDV